MANEVNRKEVSEAKQTRAYAGYYGMWIGMCWIASFGFNMMGLSQPMAGNFGLLLGLCSPFIGVRLLRGFRDVIAPLPLRRAWRMAWMMYLGAALLCTAAQYIYFAYLDDGALVRAYSEILQQPEMQDLMQQMLPVQDLNVTMEEALATFSATQPSQLAIQFLFWNSLLATFFAFPTALFSFSRPKGSEK